MQRRDFIRNSALMGTAILTVPTIIKTGFSQTNPIIPLRENIQIRHGFYSVHNHVNVFSDSYIRSIQIDRFLNPEGDLLHVDIKTAGEQMRIGIEQDNVLISDNQGTEALKRHELSGYSRVKFLTADELTDKMLSDSKQYLLLEGELVCDDQPASAPALLNLSKFNSIEVKSDQSLILVVG